MTSMKNDMARAYTQFDFEGFLSTASLVLDISRDAARTINESIAPDFSLVDLLMPDEVRLSNLIAELLNPNGRHGQGGRFLQVFLTLLAKATSETAVIRRTSAAWNSSASIIVRREVPTIHIPDRGRRMDILIEGMGHGLMIENKPWAGDQRAQLADYASDLRARFGENFTIVYLTRGGTDPSSQSIPPDIWQSHMEAGRAASMSYVSPFLEWVAECEKVCRAEPVRAALRDIARFISSEFEDLRT
jgi:hypothetical protein